MQKKLHLDEDVAAGFDALSRIQGKPVTRLVNDLLRGFLAPIFAPLPSVSPAAPPEEPDEPEEDEEEPDPELGPPVCKIDYDELEHAYEFVSAAGRFEYEAFLVMATGKILYPVEDVDLDEDGDEDEVGDSDYEEKLPDDASPDEYRPIPHAWDLDLGRDLNMRFIAARAPRFYDEVQSYFRRKGGYARFRDFVIHHDLEQAWYTYRDQETRKALLKWCRQHRIEVVFRK